ncbi:hypothetical protein H920_00128 [Fukomys damarensis]|uniref:Uncharacterized protein n=1 Tax=Fukomys damarensis TaxID=885580 RepID=A0A091E273_FUKDA|nr:hypothetical protein H920_00128 [Fukomys damarensis]
MTRGKKKEEEKEEKVEEEEEQEEEGEDEVEEDKEVEEKEVEEEVEEKPCGNQVPCGKVKASSEPSLLTAAVQLCLSHSAHNNGGSVLLNLMKDAGFSGKTTSSPRNTEGMLSPPPPLNVKKLVFEDDPLLGKMSEHTSSQCSMRVPVCKQYLRTPHEARVFFNLAHPLMKVRMR